MAGIGWPHSQWRLPVVLSREELAQIRYQPRTHGKRGFRI